MNFGIVSLKMLRALPPTEPRAAKLLACRQIIRTLVDEQPSETSHQLCRALRAVLKPITDDKTATGDEIEQAGNLLAELRTVDPRRAKQSVTDGRASDTDLLASCSTGTATGPTGSDEWDTDGPLSNEEAFRLIEVERPFQNYVRGQFILAPGANVQAMFSAALGSRAFNVTNFRQLYRRMSENFSLGGISLRGGPLLAELTRVLTEQGALPSVDPTAKTYGERLLEELQGRD